MKMYGQGEKEKKDDDNDDNDETLIDEDPIALKRDSTDKFLRLLDANRKSVFD